MRSAGLGCSCRISALGWAGAPGSLTLGEQGGRLDGGCWQVGGGSSALTELLPAGLAAASRGIVVILPHPPLEVTTGIGEGSHISTSELFGEGDIFILDIQ